MTPRIVEGDLLEQRVDAIVNAWNRMLWRSSERSIRDSVTNALARAREHGFGSVAFPIIGAGSGGFDEERALEVMVSTLEAREAEMDVTVVRYRRR
ncbi:macro domain-containing protein [Archangium violaceum]|uniref:Macro domain-containing protein n=1 Tax=Archangium violaceum Cb vi76 TaxID=1406225 RepID=A0A084SUU1_9BACT|nr:macro domain-containing protein [Archangium violaceum]KFA92226.1 hypothetical protein Q664_16755 [Archangium violaceum Cb vi76]